MSARSGGTLSAEAAAVLAAATVDGDAVRLPAVQLARPLYVEVNEVLVRLGGKWKGGKTRAHLFGEIDPKPLLDEIRETGAMPAKNPTAFFATPPDLARRMVELANVRALNAPDHWILEPSAGLGAIAHNIQTVAPHASLELVELAPQNVLSLRRQGYEARATLHACDFLSFTPGRRYSAILMNPPFAVADDALAYIEHIRHAAGMLAEGAILVAIAPAGVLFRSDARVRRFREDVQSVGAIEPLPSLTFKDSGTAVETVLITIQPS